MEQRKFAEDFLIYNMKYLPQDKVAYMKDKLTRLPEDSQSMINSIKMHNPTLVLVMSLLFGGFAVDRFMIGDVGLGILKICTFGGLGIWTIVDWFKTHNKARNNNYNKLMALL